jgi:hypothetical protein
MLDALQLVLVADLQRFGSTVPHRIVRHALRSDSYVRGKIGEHRFLRPGNTVALRCIRFKDSESSSISTIGVCIEAEKRAQRKGALHNS